VTATLAPASVADVAEAMTPVTDLPEITFVRPMPGFESLSTFALVTLGDDEETPVVYELRSLEQPEIRFLVAVAGAFFPEYEISLDDATCAELSLTEASDALVLTVLSSGSSTGGDDEQLNANLLAPVVINGRTRSAAQIILSGTDWPVRVALA
jgi:flagellar assembly factor FliW